MYATSCEICRSLESILTCPGSHALKRYTSAWGIEAAEGEDFSLDEYYSEDNGG
jgi:hypothetical protein